MLLVQKYLERLMSFQQCKDTIGRWKAIKADKMRLVISALLASTITLTACGSVRDSRFNPFNWFGASRSEVVQTGTTNPLIPQKSPMMRRKEIPYQGQLIDQISDLVIERVTGGALIRATGMASVQGAYDVRLVASEEGVQKGVLSFELTTLLPAKPKRQGPEQSRRVTVAVFVTDQQLEGVRTIRVQGARNARTSRC